MAKRFAELNEEDILKQIEDGTSRRPKQALHMQSMFLTVRFTNKCVRLTYFHDDSKFSVKNSFQKGPKTFFYFLLVTSMNEKMFKILKYIKFLVFFILAWCQERNSDKILEEFLPEELASTLRKFYVEVRTVTRQVYSRNSIKAI